MGPFYAASVEEAARNRRPVAHTFADHLVAEGDAVADALLAVTDRRAEKASGPLLKAYRRLRSTAKEHVKAAVPGLARTIAPFT